jgi:hypothetical protein
MGYMGLNHWEESDEAADFFYEISKSVDKLVKKELKNRANCYNTAGEINVALLIEDDKIDVGSLEDDTLKELVERLSKVLKTTSSETWEDLKSQKEHINAYKRLLKNINNKISKSNR